MVLSLGRGPKIKQDLTQSHTEIAVFVCLFVVIFVCLCFLDPVASTLEQEKPYYTCHRLTSKWYNHRADAAFCTFPMPQQVGYATSNQQVSQKPLDPAAMPLPSHAACKYLLPSSPKLCLSIHECHHAGRGRACNVAKVANSWAGVVSFREWSGKDRSDAPKFKARKQKDRRIVDVGFSCVGRERREPPKKQFLFSQCTA